MMNVNAVKCWECGAYFERAKGVCSCVLERAAKAERKPAMRELERTMGELELELERSKGELAHALRRSYNEPRVSPLTAEQVVEALRKSGSLGGEGYGPNSLPPCSYSAPLEPTRVPAGVTNHIHIGVRAAFKPTFLGLRTSGPLRIGQIRIGTMTVFEGGTFEGPALLRFVDAPITSPAIGVQLIVMNSHGAQVELDGVLGGEKQRGGDSYATW
jgi:hypothetical protein